MLVALIGATAVAAVFVVHSQTTRRSDLVERFDTRHITASRFIEAYVQQALDRQSLLASSTLVGPITQTRFDEITQENQFTRSVLLDGQGRALSLSPPNPAAIGTRLDLNDPALSAALQGQPSVTTLKIDGVTSPVIEFAVPFQTFFGRRVFAGAYTVTDTPLRPFTANAISSFKGSHVYMVDVTGMVTESDNQNAVGLPLDEVSSPLDSAITRKATGFYGQGDQRTHYFSGPIKNTPWRLIFTMEDGELFKIYTPAQQWSPWLALVAFVLMSLGILILFDRAQTGRAQAEDDHARQEAILDTTSDAFIGMDDRGLVVDWNTAASRLLGWTRDEAVGQAVSTLMVPPRDRQAHSSGMQSFLATGVAKLPRHPINLTAQHRDGHEVPVELTVSRTHWQGSWRFHAFMRDITDRLEHEKQLQTMALTDPLTALANRRAFMDNLDQAHARARRHSTRLAVLYADVDEFKSINDTYGHAAGDAILSQIADRLREHFRTEDTIGRLGGDEFAVVCEDFTSYGDSLVDRLRAVLAVPYTFRGQPVLATVSVGMASPENDESAEHLLERADTVMYHAKAANHPPTQP
jgi:diguanylate cyclase (GGDEF)-like protein/PAS domain S-box-containing protein